jgi:hypothetical protein
MWLYLYAVESVARAYGLCPVAMLGLFATLCYAYYIQQLKRSHLLVYD